MKPNVKTNQECNLNTTKTSLQMHTKVDLKQAELRRHTFPGPTA